MSDSFEPTRGNALHWIRKGETVDLAEILTGVGLALVRIGDLLGDLKRMHDTTTPLRDDR